MRACVGCVCLGATVNAFEHTSLLLQNRSTNSITCTKQKYKIFFLETLISQKYAKELSMSNNERQESKCSRDPFSPD